MANQKKQSSEAAVREIRLTLGRQGKPRSYKTLLARLAHSPRCAFSCVPAPKVRFSLAAWECVPQNPMLKWACFVPTCIDPELGTTQPKH